MGRELGPSHAVRGIATFLEPAVFDQGAAFTGAVTRKGRELFVPAGAGVAGASAGWVVTGADNGLATLPASVTGGATLIIPIPGLYVGDTVVGMRVIGQVEAAGNTGILVLSARKSLAAVGDFVDSELDTATTAPLNSDTLLSGTKIEVTALGEVVSELEIFYARLTGTTNTSVDIAVSGIIVTVDQV